MTGSAASSGSAAGRGSFPLGASVTLADLDADPYPVLAGLRETEPVSWLPALGGWLVTRRAAALRVLRDAGTFTVDDPRFSTARIVGPSMLSLDGSEHARHRDPFAGPFRRADVEARLAEFVEVAAGRLVTGIKPAGRAELRSSVAGPLAVTAVARALGLGDVNPAAVLSWYEAIVAAVSRLAGHPLGIASPAAAEAVGLLSDSVRAAISRPAGPDGVPSPLAMAASSGGLSPAEVVSNAAVAMFGGIETTEGMICNLTWHMLSNPEQLSLVAGGDGLMANAVEESLRLEPAAAVVDRYATADVTIGAAKIVRGDLVTVSLAAANRDPAFFADPDRFDAARDNARHHLAFARGPHFCIGAHLARLEARAVLAALLRLLPGVRLEPGSQSAPRGLVFRKPDTLEVVWDT